MLIGEDLDGTAWSWCSGERDPFDSIASRGTMSAETKILKALLERNRREKDAYEDVFVQYQKLLEAWRRGKERERELEHTKAKLVEAQERASSNELLKQAQAEVTKLKEENSDAYKKLYSQEKELEELRKAERQLQEVEEKVHAIEEQLDREIQAREAACSELDERQSEKLQAQKERDDLRSENQELVQRLLETSQNAAEKFNEAIRIHEEAVNMKIHYEMLLKAGSGIQNIKIKPEGAFDVEAGGSMPTKVRLRQNAHEGEATAVKLDRTGSMVATSGLDKQVRVWDTYSGKSMHVLKGMLETVTDVDFTSDARHVLAAGHERCMRLYDLSSERVKHTLNGHTDKVHACCCSPADSRRCVSSGADRMIRVWDLNRGINSSNMICMSTCFSLCLSVEGGMMCSGHFNGTIRIWDIQKHTQATDIKAHAQKVTSVSFMPAGNELLTCARDNAIHLIDLRMNEVRKSFRTPGFRAATDRCRICCSPDGRYIACGSVDGGIYVLDATTGEEKVALQGKSYHQNAVISCEWAPTGLISIDKDGDLLFWQ